MEAPRFMQGVGRRAAILPVAFVAALLVAVLVLRPSARNGQTAEDLAASSVPAPKPRATARARSAAVMLAQDRLPTLLSEGERVLGERNQYLSVLEAAHSAEPLDRAWSDAAARALVGVAGNEALAATGVAPDAWTRDCRSRSCRIEAAFDDYDDAQDWANFFLTGSGDTFAQAELSIQRGADGATHVLIFGARR